MKLRKWQTECVKQALDHFENFNKHFLCLATPGAGKTIMAAEVSAKLYQQDKIDFVLCFSPSITISQSIRHTFSKRFKSRFDGIIGAIGCSYTYQNIQFFKEDFWQLLRKNRVLVIFDEIHHCAGSSLEDANTWGEEIIQNIQQQAAYTLALTGTPWRSDKAPIVLSSYIDSDRNDNAVIQCDYVYGLKEAVHDNVCRRPKLVLIDNEKLSVKNENNQYKFFGSFKELLKESMVSYQSVITNNHVMRHILERGCSKLEEIRYMNPNAAGLVVASSVEHAAHIIQILRDEFKQSAVLVTYKQIKPSQTIRNFRHDDTQWIVSIGMVSEGTDIPRLQVCCHLSRVKTELYFRQVLGRILRVNDATNQEAWLYTFAEPKLSEFAHRIEEDLPDAEVIILDSMRDIEVKSQDINFRDNKNVPVPNAVEFESGDSTSELLTKLSSIDINKAKGKEELLNHSFEILGGYREQVIASFYNTV